MSNTQINGTGDSAYISLLKASNNSDNIEFSNASNYVYDTSTTEFVSGICKLKALSGSDKTYPFTTAANYSYSSSVIEVASGIAKLLGMPNIYAQWHLNESSGTTAADASGNGRNGTLINMEDADWVAGKLNNCLRFNEGGTKNEYVDFGNIAGFERTDKFSFEFWIKILGPSDSGVIRVTWKYSTLGYIVYIQNNHVYVFISAGGTNRIIVHGDSNVQDSNWHHVICTYDGSSSANGVNIYVNGSLDTMTTVTDALTASILTSATFKFSENSANYFLNGYLDEILVYDKELTNSEVSERYNSGSGTEEEGIPTDDPEITPKTGYSFTSNLDSFTQTATIPTNTAIKYQISDDNGTSWLYWNSTASAWQTITAGTSNTYYFNNEANSASVIHTNISSLASSGTFLFRAFLHSTDGSTTPELDNIYIKEPITFSTVAQSVTMKYDIQPTHNFNYISATQTVTIPANTSIQYQYSINSGTTYNGSWLTKANLETELLSITTAGDGTDTVRLKLRLKADTNTSTPQISNFNIESRAGYSTVGTYTSNIYNSGYSSMEWNSISWESTIPTGTSVIIKGRSSNDSVDMGSYSTAFVNGEDSNLVGKYVQWQAVLESSIGSDTPQLDNLSILFKTPLTRELNP